MTQRDATTDRLAVLGAGAMGHGIAQVAAVAGLDVALYDIEQGVLDAALGRIDSSLARLVERDRQSEADAAAARGRIATTTDLAEAARDRGLVIEAITERAEAKQALYAALDPLVAADAVVASNTSTIPISQLAAAISNPERFVGIHFFNPPQVMKLIEITAGDATTNATLQTAVDFAHRIGKEPVICRKDIAGFIVNRILGALLNEAALMAQRGEGSVEEIDSAARFQLRLPMGPFELADYIGLDVMASLVQILADHDALAEVSTAWQERVTAGDLGSKTGRGFHDWDGRPAIREGIGEDVDLVRLLAPAINSAAWIVEAGAASAEDVNEAVQLGLSFPRGIFAWVDTFGPAAIIDTLEALARQHGAWYQPCDLLRDVAAGEKTLRG